MGRRTLLLVAALVIAALGTTLVFLYVNGVDERAAEGQAQEQILVATAPIAAGTTAQSAAEQSAMELRTVASKDVAPGALSAIAPIADQVALAPIFPGEQILEGKFGAPGQTSALQAAIPEGKLAVSVQLGDPARVAGFVAPGSRVAVFVTMPTAGGGQDETKLLLPSVEVLATGASTLVSTVAAAQGGDAPEDVPKALMTLAVDQKEAQKVVYGSSHGQMYFGLLTDSSQVNPGPGTNAGNLFAD